MTFHFKLPKTFSAKEKEFFSDLQKARTLVIMIEIVSNGCIFDLRDLVAMANQLMQSSEFRLGLNEEIKEVIILNKKYEKLW